MDISNWITIAAVIVALGIGVASILHTRSIYKKERKDRLLNELIRWAEDISICCMEQEAQEIFGNHSSRERRLYIETQVNKENTFHLLLGKASYISGITRKNFSKELQNIFQNVILKLQSQKDLAIKYRKKIEKGESIESSWLLDVANKIADNNNQLYNYSEKIIEEATRIKTRDIS